MISQIQKFFREVNNERFKVNWPSTRDSFFALLGIFAFALMMGLFLLTLDFVSYSAIKAFLNV
ncbi:preprotein translocase subunit SecE [Candidatus Fokinia solitaria]|uniref:Preprotein translocase subunit SecE n=1 Tax=Candidatus Fokinia solitaria TaxID=1802984 RepID=A0A2U8BS51_9RICK|nr:preprotein translocase subunit SecE [Candidatus Fokinia solitaria]